MADMEYAASLREDNLIREFTKLLRELVEIRALHTQRAPQSADLGTPIPSGATN